MTLVRVEAPLDYPVSLDEAKANCRVDHDDDNLLISALIAAATARAERETGRAFSTQVWDWIGTAFPAGEIVIPLGPIVEVIEVSYRDGDGGEQVVDPALYRVDTAASDGLLVPVSGWPAAADVPGAVRVRFEVGQGADEDVRQAILLMVGHWYEHREDASSESLQSIPLGSAALLGLHRRMFV